MSGIIGMAVFLVFAFVWYFPLYKKKPAEKRPEPKLFWKAFLFGLGPAFLLGLVLPFAIGWVLKAAGVTADTFLYRILIHGVGYGVGEELCKFLVAYQVLRKAGYRNSSHTALLFGAVGLGFGVFESFLTITNILSALVRGFFCLHVFFQLWMGMYYAGYVEKKNAGDAPGAKKPLILAFAVPMFVHAVHDVVGTLGLEWMTSGETTGTVIGLAMFVASVVIDLVFVIATLKKVKKL